MSVVPTVGAAPSSASERLRKSGEIRAVLASGRRTRGALVDGRMRDRAEGPARLAVVAGRRVGNSVERNRAKRRLRAAARAVGLAAGKDVVLIARAGAVTGPFTQLCEEVANAVATRSRRSGGSNG